MLMKTLVITRPGEDAGKLAATLGTYGFRCLIEPMLSIEPIPENEQLLAYALEREPQAIAVTSRHALSALARMTLLRHIPVIAVGDATAAHATKLGFTPVANAGGTAHTLVKYIEEHCPLSRGHVLYACGTDVSIDLAAEVAHGKAA